MKQRRIGNVDVSAIGLGGMPMSIQGRKDRATSIATVHAALDAGVTFIDTADAYHLDADGVGHNESLIAEALASYGGDTSGIFVATKGGLLHNDNGPWATNGHPDYLKAAAKASAARLGVERIDLYQFHRPDPAVPYAESLGALRELFDEGLIRHIGISNANVPQIREAVSVLGHSLVSVQNQFSPAFRSSGVELEECVVHELAFLPWSPLGGIRGAADLADRFEVFGEVAAEYGVSPQQITLAWELHLSHLVIPIPGASRPQSIVDSAQAADLVLAPETVARLSAA
ncbi:aldo/keto reductase [Compostimonas suwonensis]|uniref:Aryl-alcohol dehydrogenase-like predicted oxidoreductase n=1 Tax=Compostimonas suwonensis TaxID=1048394 RepID=A0A2M9BW04_9MICO|nr:aldo/keto reductase [Compostimonas suwonensis]PJJ62138.1 aryl-alcohol dehydrogenase-like predicted oxidoreductase [Compostimonas suwonensis]